MTTIPRGHKVPEQPRLEAWQVEAIRRRIQEVLRLRGITVPVTLTLLERERDNGRQVLELDSEPFNTWPIIHSEMRVTTFGSNVYEPHEEILENGNAVTRTGFYVGVYVRYEGNGTELFTTSGQVQAGERGVPRVFFEDEKHAGDRRYMRDTITESDIY